MVADLSPNSDIPGAYAVVGTYLRLIVDTGFSQKQPSEVLLII